MRTVAVVPIKGRMPLVKITIGRLIMQGLEVVCIGSRASEKVLCEALGATFIMIPDNICLGAKWQMGIDYARKLKPYSIMIMGSSDMVQDGWVKVMNEQLAKGYAMCGTESIYFLDIQKGNKKRMAFWGGYQGARAGEPLGTGRVISAKALDLIDWQLINKSINSSIDYSICQNLEPVRPHFVKLIHNQKDLKSLSISTYQWENMHKFEKEILNPSAILISPDEIINKYFPEMFNLFKE
jgi:hypothetical protein